MGPVLAQYNCSSSVSPWAQLTTGTQPSSWRTLSTFKVSFAGAIAGGLLLGVVEALWGGYVATGWVDIVGFAMVILTLVFRPYGLFSKRSERA